MPYKKTNLTLSTKAFSLVELLVVVSIIAVLSSILAPALSKTLGDARSTSCMNNMRTLYGFTSIHIDDNDGFFPMAGFTVHDKSFANPETNPPGHERYGYTWDDFLGAYDGRNLTDGNMEENGLYINPDRSGDQFFDRSSTSNEYYMCPEDDFERRTYNAGTRLGRTYVMNSHDIESNLNQGEFTIYDIDQWSAKGIGAGANSVSTDEIESAQDTIYLAEGPNPNNDLGGANSHVSNPNNTIDPSINDTLLSRDRLGLHSSYTAQNFLITDGHVKELFLEETHDVNQGDSVGNANKMWSRQAGD
jgi:prepilin-type N-terminal cleavage/methylation domain-containing protein